MGGWVLLTVLLTLQLLEERQLFPMQRHVFMVLYKQYVPGCSRIKEEILCCQMWRSKQEDVKTQNGCRKLHQFVNISTTYQLLVKKRSCYCAHCRHGREECPNKMYTGEYKERSLNPTNVFHHQLPKTRSAYQSTPESSENTSSHPRLSETCSGQQERSFRSAWY